MTNRLHGEKSSANTYLYLFKVVPNGDAADTFNMIDRTQTENDRLYYNSERLTR